MKKLVYLLIVITMTSCDLVDSPDCIQTAGSIIDKEFAVDSFTKITVFERTQLIVSEGPQSVTLETGENLLDEISIEVKNNRLIIKNDNGCNLAREYGVTKVYVTAPNLTEIRNSSGLTVKSEGVLSYNNLTLLSEDFEEEDAFHTDGDFDLDLDVANLTITQNNLSNFFLRGAVGYLDLNFVFGDARFEGRHLIVQYADIYHRGTNDIIINPQVELFGEILSTGDVIVVNTPPFVDVDELWTGDLIFED